MKRIFLYLVAGWAVLFLTIVWFADFDPQMQPLLQISDYLMTFHVAGSLVAHSQLDKLYPPAGSIAFAGMPFDIAAHHLLPKMPPSSVAEFMYMPLAAAVFVPFSFLPLNISLFSWQLLSLAAVFVSSQLMWLASKSVNIAARTDDKNSGDKNTSDEKTELSEQIARLLSALLLIPVCLTVWIGQVGAVFGMLPLAAGYYMLHRKKMFWAGILWSFAIFKPQFLVPVSVILFALAVRKSFSAFFGLAVGLVIIALVGVGVFSPALNLEWLNVLKTSDIVYSDPRSGIATHLATSLPRTLILMSSTSMMPTVKLIAYASSALIYLGALAVLWFVQKSAAKVEKIESGMDYNYACLVGIFVTPLVMPHFFLYDYCLFALALPLVYGAAVTRSSSFSIKRLMLAAVILINVYSLIVLVAHQYAIPLIFVLLLLILFLLLARALIVSKHVMLRESTDVIPPSGVGGEN